MYGLSCRWDGCTVDFILLHLDDKAISFILPMMMCEAFTLFIRAWLRRLCFPGSPEITTCQVTSGVERWFTVEVSEGVLFLFPIFYSSFFSVPPPPPGAAPFVSLFLYNFGFPFARDRQVT